MPVAHRGTHVRENHSNAYQAPLSHALKESWKNQNAAMAATTAAETTCELGSCYGTTNSTKGV